MNEDAITRLERERKIERVAADPEMAAVEIDDALKHVDSAALLIDRDPVMAYTALYDAARKAVAAHMRANGYRVVGKVGYHAKTMAYAEAALAGVGLEEHLSRLDEMRSIRNDTEYRGRRVGRAEIEADLESARGVVAAVRDAL